jgi:SAM-dependent methyltransferase
VTKPKTEKAPKADIPSCPVCKSTQARVFRTGVRGNPTRLVYVCPSCALRFLDPPSGSLKEYYQGPYREKYDYTPGKQLTSEERFLMMRPLMEYRTRYFKEEIPKGGSVLEIGCSAGFFLDTIRDDYEVFGAEWNPEDAAYVRDVGEIPCEEGDLADIYPGKKFSAICAYQVLEHQADPIAWFKQVGERLVGGGHLIIEVPNSEDALLTLYNIPAYRDFWYREPHICNFNLSNLVSAASVAGYEARAFSRQEFSLWNHMNWVWNEKRTNAPSVVGAVSVIAPAVSDR